MAKKRLIVFGDSNSFITTILYNELLRQIPKSHFEIVGVVNTTTFVPTNHSKKFVLFVVKKMFNPFDKKIIYNKYQTFLKNVDKVLLLETSKVNDKNFLVKIKKLNPDFALLIGCPQIFKSEIIACFDSVINYHNSLLPKYRGLEATSWSIQHNETYTGFTYHYVNEGIDTGNIIIQDKIEICYKSYSFKLEIEKTKLASKKLFDLLGFIAEGYEGIKQSRGSSYFGKKEKEKLLTLEKLEDKKKIQKLIDIWGGVFINQNNQTIFVTRIGKNGAVKRIKYLPPFIFYLYQTIKSVFSFGGNAQR